MMRRILFVLVLAALLVGTASAELPVTDGLVAAYDFRQGADPATLYDISGNGHNGVISGGATWVDEGIAFDGVDDTVNLGTGLGSLEEHTVIIAQYENTGVGSYGTIAGRYDYAAKVGFNLNKWNRYPYEWRARYYDDADPENPVSREGEFYQQYPGWAVLHSRYDGSTVDVGFDLLPGLSMDVPAYRDTQAYPFVLGGRPGSYYNGTIGYALIYNRALSDSELETAYVAIHDEMAARGVDDYLTPYVSFTYTADGDETETGTPIHFQSTISSDATSWQWDFGDGTTSTERNPTHTFTETGTYRVNLTVTNIYGSRSFFRTFYVPFPEHLALAGLVAAYDFRQGADPATLYDISGNGHNGVISGGATWVDEGIAFDGVDDTVNLGTGLGSLEEHTVIIAQYENTITGVPGTLAGRYDYAAKVGFNLNKWNRYPYEWRFRYCDGTDPENPVSRGDEFYQRYPGWAVLHSRYDGSVVDVGFDARPGPRLDVPAYRDTQAYPFVLGGRPGSYYNGTIGYALIYNRALSDSELESVYLEIRDEMSSRGVADLPGPRVKFDPPMLIMTFDDSLATEYTNGLPIAAARGVPCTSYTISGVIGTDYGGERLTWEQLHEMRAAGWGIEDHTYNHHIPITDLSDAELLLDLQMSDAAFVAAGLPPPEHISYPGTVADERTVNIIDDFRVTGRGYSKRQNLDVRTIIEWDEPQYWDDPHGWYRIDQLSVNGDVLSEELITAIDRAAEEGTALFLYTHGIGDVGEVSTLSQQAFGDLLDYTLAKGFDPITVDGFYRAMQGIRTRPATGPLILHGETTRATYNSTVDYVGFVWGTTRHNNPEGTAPSAAGYDSHWISAPGDYKEDEFSYIPGFTPETEYYYRSAARIDGTWYYGEELTYTVPVSLPYVSFTYTADGDETSTGTPIHFQSTISGDATSWQWDFGDGATSTERNPTHTFTATGTYHVTLTATNAYGSRSFSHTFHVYSGTVIHPTQPPTTPPPTWPYPPDPTPSPTLNGSAFKWDPETGYYTSYWFNRDSGFIDVHGLFFSLMLPLTQIFGSWVFLIIWGTLCMGFYLYTQDTTMPFIVGVLGGSMRAFLMGEDALVVMLLTMAFAGGGILAKVLLGRV